MVSYWTSYYDPLFSRPQSGEIKIYTLAGIEVCKVFKAEAGKNCGAFSSVEEWHKHR